MKKSMCRATALLLCTALLLPLSACWSRREINTLAIVLGTALDVGPEPDTITLTAQMVRAGELRTATSGPESSGGGDSSKPYVNLQNTGKSVLSLVRSATHLSNLRLYFPHNQVLIFGSELAKTDINEGLDAFLRDYEARMNVYILIAKNTAAEILDEEPELEKIPAAHIAEMMENQRVSFDTAIVTLRDFAIAILSGSTAPVAPMVELQEANGKKKAVTVNTAVFKEGKMIGELDLKETSGLLWVTGKTKSGVITVDTQWGQVVLEIVHSKSRLKAVKEKDGELRMQLTVKEDGFIESNETYEDMATPDNVKLLKDLEKEAIRADIESALKKAHELKADVFGFGDAIRRNYPKEWEEMKKDWDNIFPQIPLDIEIEVELRSTGGLFKPIVPGGAA